MKKAISWPQLIRQVMGEVYTSKEARRNAMRDAGHRWADIKAGRDPEYSAGTAPKQQKKKTRKPKRRHSKHPRKGQASRTRKGRKDFVTHKGDKMYNRRRHRQTRSASGKSGRPYSRKGGSTTHHSPSSSSSASHAAPVPSASQAASTGLQQQITQQGAQIKALQAQTASIGNRLSDLSR